MHISPFLVLTRSWYPVVYKNFEVCGIFLWTQQVNMEYRTTEIGQKEAEVRKKSILN